jgi:hypothetical protein
MRTTLTGVKPRGRFQIHDLLLCQYRRKLYREQIYQLTAARTRLEPGLYKAVYVACDFLVSFLLL